MSEDGAAADGRDPLPARTTPTWEMELLVSGGTTFGLLQLPPVLDRMFFHAVNAASLDISELLRLLYVYAKVALITLVLTFVVHLCLRGYWVALVGMDSVYRGGVRWDRLRMGPVARRVSHAMVPTMGSAVEAADNRATRAFGVGVGFAMVMLIPALLMLAGIGVAIAARPLVGALDASLAFAVLMTVALGPWLLASLLDGEGRRALPAGSRRERWVAAAHRVYGAVGLGRHSNLPLAMFVSHEGRLRMAFVAVLVMVPVLALVVAPIASTDRSGWLDDPTFATPRTSGALPVFYADSGADRATPLPLPSIATRVASGPYLPVFVPFVPRRHMPALRRACPAVSWTWPASPGASDQGQRDCLRRLVDLRVDGRPVAVAFEASVDPQTGQRGFLAMLPMRGVAPGRHELGLMAPVRGSTARDRIERVRIPFWR